MDFSATGYARMRGVVLQELDLQKSKGGAALSNQHRFGLITYNQMRFRVEPMLKVNDYISMDVQMDIFDNIAFGTKDTKQIQIDNPFVGTISLPPGSGSISMVGSNAGENAALNLRRAYMDVLLPVGLLRVGRQPSHWGLGIFQNDGNEPQADFGDSADRVLFLTQFVLDGGDSISAGLLWDIAFEAQYDPRTQGLAGAISNNGKDAQQYAATFLYENDDLAVGVLGGLRRRSGGSGTTTTAIGADGNTWDAGIDGKTQVYFADIYARYNYNEYNFAFEGVYLGGKMSTGVAVDAVPFDVGWACAPGAPESCGIIQLKPEQDVQVFMAAFEANARYKWGGEWAFQSGYASGDASPLSQRITQYGFRPDYQIAFLMFHYPLGSSPAMVGTGFQTQTTDLLGGKLPITGNFINNAAYVTAAYKHHFDVSSEVKECNDLAVGAKLITAWAPKNPVDLNFQTVMEGNTSLPILANSAKWYGVEADIIAETRFYDHFYAGLEGGILVPGAAYNVQLSTQVSPGGIIQTIPYSKASIAYGGRMTLIVNF